jgi:hypothetical protein
MNIWKAMGALILTPFVAIGAFFVALIISSVVWYIGEEYGDDILGIGCLLGWLTLIFFAIYKLL